MVVEWEESTLCQTIRRGPFLRFSPYSEAVLTESNLSCPAQLCLQNIIHKGDVLLTSMSLVVATLVTLQIIGQMEHGAKVSDRFGSLRWENKMKCSYYRVKSLYIDKKGV